MCGQFNEHIRLIESRLGVEINNRGNSFTVTGDAGPVESAKSILKKLYDDAGDNQLKGELSELQRKRQLLSGEIDPQAVEFYEKLREQKGQTVAKVEQGICRGCRISLSSSELQRARSGNLVQCSSCGRILFLP